MALDVHIEGHRAGSLTRDRADLLTFTYAPEYAAAGTSTPLSLSMPIRQREHAGEVPQLWVDNLLPDNDDTRAAIAAKFDSRAVDAYSLLHHIGMDVAGAVQFTPAGQPVDRSGNFEPWDSARISKEIDRLHADPSDVDDDVEIGHWSLAGQHGKFALALVEGHWMEPTGARASTHIFKVGMSHLKDSDVAEFVTMRAAKSMGIRVADVQMRSFDGRMAMIVKRYDRAVDPEHGVVRLHQEDLCQALGIGRLHKYESEGGPSVARIHDLISASVSATDRERSTVEFAKLQAFNMVVANTDAHGKNSSLLLRGPQVRLAPAYDLISGALVWEPKTTWFKGKMAMKFGGDYRLRALDARRTQKAAIDFGVDPEDFVAAVADLSAQVGGALNGALDDAAGAGVDSHVIRRLRARAAEWADRIDGVCGPATPGAAKFLTASPAWATLPSPTLPKTQPSKPVGGRVCGAYIARTRSTCVLPENHPGWPKKGHRASR